MPPQYDSKQESSPEVQRLQSGSESDTDLSDSGEAIGIKKRLKRKRGECHACDKPATFRLRDSTTGVYYKHSCKQHKTENQRLKAPNYRHRYHDMQLFAATMDAEIAMTEEEWKKLDPTSHENNPSIRCLRCNDVVTTTTLNHFVRHTLGCRCRSLIPFRDRYDEVCEHAKTMDAEIAMTEEEWKKLNPTNQTNNPSIRCLRCNDVVTTTTLNHFVHGQLGCRCPNKTEAIVVQRSLISLYKKDANTLVDTRRGRVPVEKLCVKDKRRWKFWDHRVTRDGHVVNVETDGPQHTDRASRYAKDDTAARDFEKQQAAKNSGQSLVRFDQAWAWSSKDARWLSSVFYTMMEAAFEAGPGTLVLLDQHYDKYVAAGHVDDWDDGGGLRDVVQVCFAGAKSAHRLQFF